MKTISFLIVVGACLLLGVRQTMAQNKEVVYNKNSWYTLVVGYRFHSKWSAHTEIHARRNGLVFNPQQFVFRLGAQYHYSPRVVFTLGGSHIHKSPYGAQPTALPTSEHNLYEQVSLKQTLGWFGLQHRYRIEQRWVDKVVELDNRPQIHGKKYLTRLRYRLSAKLPLNSHWFVVGGNEVFIDTSTLTTGNTFNQNWLFGSIGYQLNQWAQVKMGYLHQFIKKSTSRAISNHTFTLGLFCHFNKN